MYAIIETALYILDLYWWVVVCAVIMSWLISFGIVNRYNRFAMTVADVLDRMTEPALRPIRRIMPNFGGLDLSPIILLIIIYFLKVLISVDLPRLVAPIY